MRAAVIGAVESSAVAVRSIAASDIDLVGVLGQEPADQTTVSGYRYLRPLAEAAGAEYVGFRKVNDEAVVQQLRDWDLDYVFVVGLSQLVSAEVLGTARHGCVGYHPTALPYGRGRAPVAWLVLQKAPAASTLFVIEPGADTGGVLEQVHFVVGPRMDAADVLGECCRTLEKGLERLLPRLERGWWDPEPQDEEIATYLGRRDAFDGLIDWLRPAHQVDGLIRAAAPPHPGAYCYHNGRRLRILRSEGVGLTSSYTGVPGKVLRRDGYAYEIQCDPGVIRISSVVDEQGESVDLRDGTLLRTRVEDELHELRAQVADLTKIVAGLLRN